MMGRIFVDTNIFVRYLTGDDPKKATRVKHFFELAKKGVLELCTNEMIVAELIWVLSSYYDCSKDEVFNIVSRILSLKFLVTPRRDLLYHALFIHKIKNVDFIDAYTALFMKEEGIQKIATFDKTDFKRFDWVERIEP